MFQLKLGHFVRYFPIRENKGSLYKFFISQPALYMYVK